MLHQLANRIRAGECLIGTWLYLNDIGVAEIVAGAGFDFVMIDMEHSPTGFSGLRELILAVEHHTAPMVRVKANAPEFISSVLDLGPAGVMVPRVNTPEQAKFAVQNCKYQPLGLRGFGPYRLSDYTRNLKEVLAKANEMQMLWVQIEHADAVKNLSDIVKVPGIDAFFIGPGDLSHSINYLGQFTHPSVLALMEDAVRVIRGAGIPVGSAFLKCDALASWAERGMRLFTVAADFRFVLDGATATHCEARKTLNKFIKKVES